MAEITPSTLSTRLERGDDLYILDIRHEDEFEDWHIPGSENIPIYDELKTDPEAARAALARVPEDEEVVTVCAAGVVSKEATEQLRQLGYDAKTLVDGMNGWSRVHRAAPIDADVAGRLVQVARPGKGCLSHVLISDGAAVVFDPSQYGEQYETVLSEHDAELTGVLDTHAHADHVSGGRRLADEHDVPYYLHPEDAENVDVTQITDGQTIDVGDTEVTVVHTPGHSPGSVTFAIGQAVLLTGDTLFHDSVGRVELGVEAGIEESNVEANAETLYESLERIRDRPGDPLVLPAHDPGTPDPPVAARLSEVERRNQDLQRSRTEFVSALASSVPEHPPNFRRIKRANAGTADVAGDELAELEAGPNRCAAE